MLRKEIIFEKLFFGLIIVWIYTKIQKQSKN